MKKRMEQLIKGNFQYTVPQVILSEKEILVKAKEGESYKGELFFGAEDNSKVKGMMFSTNRRIVLAKDQFSGNTVYIQYGIDTSGLCAGDTCTGEIVISSNLGEYRIQVKVTVLDKEVKTSQGDIKNLNQFTELARADYHEAFRLFTKDAFRKLLQGEDEQYTALYRGMAQNPVTYQNMEEFLIGAKKKEAVELSVDKSVKELLRMESSTKDSLFIYKNTWGYTRIEIEVEGDFLEVEKKVVTTEDFIGSVYGLEYVILREKLGKGKRRGRIIIKTVYGTQVFEICASASRDYEINTRNFENKIKQSMLRDYLELSAGKIQYREWREQIFANLEELKSAGCFTTIHQLFESYVYFAEDNMLKALEALWLLKGREFGEHEAQEQGLYLYLAKETQLLVGEEANISEQMQSLYRKNQESILLLMLLLRVDEEFANMPVKQLFMLERQFDMGSTSPFLYLEAVRILVKDESHLKKLSAFMIQTLAFAAKYNMLNQELGMRIAYMSTHEKKFKNSIYRILVACYEVYSGKDILEAICKLVMLGQPDRKEYFKWYALAVEQGVRITRLYEFYIETMGKNYQEPLPRPVHLYFSYNNTLSSRKKAFLYAIIIRNKAADKHTYESYREEMETFTAESVKAGKINEDYAMVYQEFLMELPDKAMGEAAAKAAFTYRLYCDDPKVRNVIVCHSAFEKEDIYPCNDNIAFINIYTEDAQIIFEDAKHRRYVATVAYNLQKLMDEKAVVSQCMGLDVTHDGLLLHVCGSKITKTKVDIHNLGCFQHLAESGAFTEEYKQEARRKLLQYYDLHAGNDTLNDYLKAIDYHQFYKVDCVLLIDILIRRGFYQEAFSLVCEYGYEKIDVVNLFKLCRRVILDMEFIENEELLQLAYHVLSKSKYDEVILGYLRDSYIGPVDTMITVWEKLRGFQMDTYACEEEILLMAMYSRVYRPKLSRVLEGYIRNRGKESVVAAFITFLAYGYFLGDIRIDGFVLHSLESTFQRGWEMDIICSLALLKRYRFCKKLTGRQKKNVIEILAGCRKQGLRFAFFTELPKECTKSFQLEDRIFIEEMIHPKAKVTLHYAIERSEEGSDGERVFLSEPLKKHYHGIFNREFLLFYGESLTWYMTITLDETIRQTEPQTVNMDTVTMEGKTKYQMLNVMLANRRLGKDQALDAAMEKFLGYEQITEHIFTLVE